MWWKVVPMPELLRVTFKYTSRQTTWFNSKQFKREWLDCHQDPLRNIYPLGDAILKCSIIQVLFLFIIFKRTLMKFFPIAFI